LPGRKILIRGNHDFWWSTLGRLRRSLPPGLEPLHNTSLRAEAWWVCGARGWSLPSDGADPADVAIFTRELGRLRLSLSCAPSGPRLAMLHYPPWMPGIAITSVVDLLIEFGVELCVYGHLHAMAPGTYPEGPHRGIEFHCVSADLVDFAPLRIA
jgi:predicted phosphohydrolase